MLRAPKGNSKGSEKGNYQHSVCCASPHFHIKTLKIQTSSYVSTSSLKLWSIFMPVCLKFSQWTRHVIQSVTLSYTRWLYKPKCGFVSPFSQGKTSVSAQELPFKEWSVWVLFLLMSLELPSLLSCSLKSCWTFPLDFEVYGKPHQLSHLAYTNSAFIQHWVL